MPCQFAQYQPKPAYTSGTFKPKNAQIWGHAFIRLNSIGASFILLTEAAVASGSGLNPGLIYRRITMKKSIAILASMLFATASYATDFKAMDTDANGVISDIEFVAAYPSATEDTLAAIDLDKNGSLDETEVTTATAAGILPSE
jgi:hypothetical protein